MTFISRYRHGLLAPLLLAAFFASIGAVKDDAEARKAAADRYLRFSQAVRDEVLTPASCAFSPAAIVMAVGTDPQKLTDFIRERIAYEPCNGAVRGAQGALAAKAGGDWDRALLLQSLLAEAGYKSALMVVPRAPQEVAAVVDEFLKRPPVIRSWYTGVNSDEQALAPPIALLQRFGISPENRKIYGIAEAARLRRLRGEALDAAAHETPLLIESLAAATKLGQSFDAWRQQLNVAAAERVEVEIRPNNEPRVLSIAPESGSLDAARVAAATSIEQIPPEKIAKLRLRLELTIAEEGKPSSEPIKLLDHELALGELFAKPMRLEIVPSDDAASAKPVASWTKPEWYKFVTGFNAFQAILRIGDEWEGSKVFDQEGQIHSVSSDGRIEGGSKLGGAVAKGFGGFGGLGGEAPAEAAKPKSSIESLVLTIELQLPGEKPRVQQRLIYGKLRPGVTPVFTADILATAAPVSAHTATWLLLDAVTRNAPLAARIAAGDDPRRFEQTEDAARLPVMLYDWQLLRLLAAQRLAAEGSGLTYVGGPSIVMHATNLITDASDQSVSTRHVIDVVVDDGMLVPTTAERIEQAARANVSLGVAATVAESALLRVIDPTNGARGAYSASEDARAAGTQPAAITPDQSSAGINTGPLAAWSLARNESGRAVLFPQPEGGNSWWSIDPATGRTIGRGDGGEGQSAAEYLQITKKNIENLKCMVAMSNQILGGVRGKKGAQAWLMCMTGTDNPGNGHGVPGAVEGWIDPKEKFLDIGVGPLADALGGAKDLYDIMDRKDPILFTGR